MQSEPAITRPTRCYQLYAEHSFWFISPLLVEKAQHTIREMDEREAKDFLVQQTADQAAIEGIPLSDLEKRMMYFTESGYVPEEPIALTEEFEARYDTPEYERKVSKLLENAHKRISKESDAKRKIWDEAIGVLRGGDHYLLVLWDLTSFSSILSRIPLRTVLRLALRLVLLVLLAVGAIWGLNYFSRLTGIRASFIYIPLVLLGYLAVLFRRDLPMRFMLIVTKFLIGASNKQP
jgi:hypothetical protein